MKKIAILMFSGIFSVAVMAQKNETKKNEKQPEVPVVVKTAFQKEFPKVTDAIWEEEKENFEAEFKQNGVNIEAVYNNTGHRIKLEITIKAEQLPASATSYIKTNFADYKMKEIEKSTNDKNTVTYSVELKKDKEELELTFDANGKFLKKEIEKEEKD